MPRIKIFRSCEDNFLLELLEPTASILNTNVDTIDDTGLFEIENKLKIEVFPPTRPYDSRGGYSNNNKFYSLETDAERSKRKKYLDKKYFK